MGPGGPGRGPRERLPPRAAGRGGPSPLLHLICRQLSRVKLRLEKGGVGKWVWGKRARKGARNRPKQRQRWSPSTPLPLLLIFRQLSGVKLRLEKGGVGRWARGKGPGKGAQGDGPRQLARRPKETPSWKVSCMSAGCFAKGKPSQEKKH